MNRQEIYKSAAGEALVMELYDSLLANWALPYETALVPTRHGDTFVVSSGLAGGPALFLLHGAGSNSAVWAQDVADYGRYYQVYAVDLLGEAGRSAPVRPPWEGPAFAEWLEDLYAALAVKQATLAGISQGAWTALKFAVSAPERVEKLVLMCPGGIVADRLSFLLKALPLTLLGDWGARRLTRLVFAEQPVPDGVEEVLTIINTHFKPRTGVLPLFSDEELQRLTMPTLLLGGSQDALRDMTQIASRLEALLPDLTVKILPGAGHALLETTPHVLPFLLAQEPAPA